MCRKPPPAETPIQLELVDALRRGAEKTCRRILRGGALDPLFAEVLHRIRLRCGGNKPLSKSLKAGTGHTPLHLVWDCWLPQFGLEGAVEVVMKGASWTGDP